MPELYISNLKWSRAQLPCMALLIHVLSTALKSQHGILAEPLQKRGKERSQEVQERVIHFYEDESTF